MSLKSWKEEFYPITAKQLFRKTRNVGALIEHSLRKWRGVTKENLEKHGLITNKSTFFMNITLTEPERLSDFWLDTNTCALCQKFYRKAPICAGCPLRQQGKSCFDFARGYRVHEDTGNPEVLIRELEGALEKWRKENGQS